MSNESKSPSERPSETPAVSMDHVLESVTDGILVVDREKRIVYANEHLASMYGRTAEELVGQRCEDVIGFEHCQNCPHSEVTEGGDSFTGHNLRCPHISHGPYCVSASPFVDAKGEVIGMVEIYRDMRALGAYIEGIQSEKVEIEHERRRLDAILTDSSDGYFSASLDRTILSADSKLLKLLGKSEDEVVGKPCPDVFGSDKCRTDCPILWAKENDKNVIGCREQIETASGNMPIDKSIFVQKNTDGDIQNVIGVLRNASEIVELRRSAEMSRGMGRLVSRNARMEEVFALIRTFGPTESAVLILGESGTGKELVANALQEVSPRRDRRFMKINCSALAENLMESELFGHVKGSFTGATQDKRGLFEVANGGTLFLDEIGEMSPNLQTKLLRVLEQKEFERVGGTDTIRVDVRIIAATNLDLRQAIRDGSFRQDLYYRLNAIQINLPPLRNRPEDIPLLVERFLGELNANRPGQVVRISARALDMLQRYSWPGNIRELRNAIEFAHVCAREGRIERQDLPESIRSPEPDATVGQPQTLNGDAAELREAMRRHGGNRQRVAAELGISRTTLWRRLKELNLS